MIIFIFLHLRVRMDQSSEGTLCLCPLGKCFNPNLGSGLVGVGGGHISPWMG